MDLSESEIQDILIKYKQQKDRMTARYERVKDTDEFKQQNRARAKQHYQCNKDVKKAKYDNNKEYMMAKSSYYYYKKNDNLDKLKLKYPDRYEILVCKGYAMD
tara:strand:- start:9462 stop:9770 length:309 start_codon:yes stop_codon:yes gene_type:complete